MRPWIPSQALQKEKKKKQEEEGKRDAVSLSHYLLPVRQKSKSVTTYPGDKAVGKRDLSCIDDAKGYIPHRNLATSSNVSHVFFSTQ
jgi:hypothetical protein